MAEQLPSGLQKSRPSQESTKEKLERPRFNDEVREKDVTPTAGRSPIHATAGSPASPLAVSLASTIPADIFEKVRRQHHRRLIYFLQVRSWRVKQAAISQGKGQGKATSRTHAFKPPASIQEALDFLKAQSVRNCTLVFTNTSAMGFADGQFIDLDDFGDDSE